MTSDAFSEGLRHNLEAWEREVSAYWDDLTRSPAFLERVSRQLNASLRSHQHVMGVMQNAAWHVAIARQQGSRELYLLERLERRINELEARIDRLDERLRNG